MHSTQGLLFISHSFILESIGVFVLRFMHCANRAYLELNVIVFTTGL